MQEMPSIVVDYSSSFPSVIFVEEKKKRKKNKAHPPTPPLPKL